MGTELYVLTIAPWMNREITNEALKSHIDILKGLSNPSESVRKHDKEKSDGKRKNVILFNRHFKKKKKKPISSEFPAR
jgi:hypothetical protein